LNSIFDGSVVNGTISDEVEPKFIFHDSGSISGVLTYPPTLLH